MPERFINPVPQYADGGNDLIPSGILVFLETGTATAKDVFADPSLKISLGNEVSLDGAGRVPNIWLNGSYKVRLHEFSGDAMDPLGTQLWERDPVGGNVTGAGQDWAAGNIYGLDDIVKGSNGKYYISIIANNLGSDPTSTPAAWSELQWFQLWNTNATYGIGNLVKGSDGLIYTSLAGSNQGNDPTTDGGDNWRSAAPSDGTLPVTGTDTYTAIGVPATPKDGQTFTLQFANANTGASTINGKTAETITGVATPADYIRTDVVTVARYDLAGDKYILNREVERGSNANGDFIKHADGSLRCEKVNTQSVTTSVAGTSIFSNTVATTTYPHAFSSLPIPLGSADITSGIIIGVEPFSPTTTTIRFRVSGDTAGSAGDISYVAVGKWY